MRKPNTIPPISRSPNNNLQTLLYCRCPIYLFLADAGLSLSLSLSLYWRCDRQPPSSLPTIIFTRFSCFGNFAVYIFTLSVFSTKHPYILRISHNLTLQSTWCINHCMTASCFFSFSDHEKKSLLIFIDIIHTKGWSFN